jgi:anti-sigma factor RsiW
MGRQKKSEHVMDRITALALDEIHPKAELELLAHAGECEACRDAYNDAKAVRALIDRSVEKLVAGEPSPQFNVRLRAKLRQEPASARWSWSFSGFPEMFTVQTLSYVAGAAVLVAIVAVIGLTRHQHSAPLLAAIPVTAVPSPGSPSSSQTSFQSTAPVPERRQIKQTSRAIRSVPAQSEPEILVPKGELVAVAQFYEATQTGRVDTEQLYAAQQQIRQPVEVKPIEIVPLESPAEVPLADSGSGPSILN